MQRYVWQSYPLLVAWGLFQTTQPLGLPLSSDVATACISSRASSTSAVGEGHGTTEKMGTHPARLAAETSTHSPSPDPSLLSPDDPVHYLGRYLQRRLGWPTGWLGKGVGRDTRAVDIHPPCMDN